MTGSDSVCEADARWFPADVRQVARARALVARVLGAHPRLDDAALVVSELFANAVQHGSRPGALVLLDVRLLGGGEVDIAVTDSGAGHARPEVTWVALGAESGRGLAIVNRLATQWNAHPAGGGHRVHAMLGPVSPEVHDTMTGGDPDAILAAFPDKDA